MHNINVIINTIILHTYKLIILLNQIYKNNHEIIVLT